MTKQQTIEVLSVPDICVGNMDCEDSINTSDKQWQEAYKKGYNRAMLDYGLEYDEKPVEDCISKTDILDAVGHGTTYTSEEIQEIINRLPSVAPARTRGKWVQQNDINHKLFGWYRCSECGAYIGVPSKYCSECGADMTGEEE